MQKVGSNFQPLGICQRLINFILSLLSRSVNRGSAEEIMPEEEGSSRNYGKSSNTIQPIKPNGTSSSSDHIEVEFRHVDGSENWRQIDGLERTTLIHSPKKDGDLVLSHDRQAKHQEAAGLKINKGQGQNHSAPNTHDHSHDKKNGTRTQGKGLQELEVLTKDKAPMKNVIVIKESEREDERNKKKVGNILGDRDQATNSNHQSHDHPNPKPPRRLGPLLSVASNINEKSDAYINSRKKAMRRNYSLDPEIS